MEENKILIWIISKYYSKMKNEIKNIILVILINIDTISFNLFR